MIEAILTLVVLSFLLTLSPGPSMAFVAASAAAGGTRRGVAASLGMAVGGCLLAVMVAFVVHGFILAQPDIFILVGACLMAWLGFKELQATFAPVDNVACEDGHRSAWGTFGTGVVVEMFNPKTAIFLAALIPQFATTPVAMAGLGLIVPLMAIPTDLVTVRVITRIRDRMAKARLDAPSTVTLTDGWSVSRGAQFAAGVVMLGIAVTSMIGTLL